MMRRRDTLLGALLLGLAVAGCESNDNPYEFPPMLVGTVRLDASLSDDVGNATGTRTWANADGVRAWLTEGGRAIDSTLTERGVYRFMVTRNHVYRVQVGIPPAFADSTAPIQPTADKGFYLDTLRLARVGAITSSPNPFTGQVRVVFTIAANTHMDVEVYDLSARRVRVLVSSLLPAGTHAVIWDGQDDAAHEVADGTYWVVLRGATESRAELVIKE